MKAENSGWSVFITWVHDKWNIYILIARAEHGIYLRGVSCEEQEDHKVARPEKHVRWFVHTTLYDFPLPKDDFLKHAPATERQRHNFPWKTFLV